MNTAGKAEQARGFFALAPDARCGCRLSAVADDLAALGRAPLHWSYRGFELWRSHLGAGASTYARLGRWAWRGV